MTRTAFALASIGLFIACGPQACDDANHADDDACRNDCTEAG